MLKYIFKNIVLIAMALVRLEGSASLPENLLVTYVINTVNSENFKRIFEKSVKDIFAALKICD